MQQSYQGIFSNLEELNTCGTKNCLCFSLAHFTQQNGPKTLFVVTLILFRYYIVLEKSVTFELKFKMHLE